MIMVLGALTILAVMLAEFQDETSAELGSALSARDSLKAEYAAKSAINLSRLLIASEPTIRNSLAPLFLLMKRGPPQIPVWEFSDVILGAFNDQEGAEAFNRLASVNLAEGRNLGLEDARFEINIVDEDSKINLNQPARGDAFSQARLAAELIGLMSAPQYAPLFENPDENGTHHDLRTICSAIIDWSDPDQETYVCDPHSGTVQQAGAEDSYYQQLDDAYMRKNAAFDSLAELHRVRGVGDDFWATFVDPDPDKPEKRVMTVWGQRTVNINTANPQVLLGLVCSQADETTELCFGPQAAQWQMTLLSTLKLVKTFTSGVPIFSSPSAFTQMLKKQGPFGAILEGFQFPDVRLRSESEFEKALGIESKVFSIYATGVVQSGRRETRVRVHAVIDFRDAPPPGMNPNLLQLQDGAASGSALAGQAGQTGTTPNLPEGAADTAIAGALVPNPAGTIIYYRVN